MLMLNSVGERTPSVKVSFKMPLYGCVVSGCCVGFASLDVVCHDCDRNVGL